MNEHIQELINAYLHRGSTPAQEKELFEACKRDPQTAELLRQHLILSLKLRQLRNDVDVDASLHTAVSQRIAALDKAPVPTALSEPAASNTPRRFRLAHLFGTGFATAAAAAAVVLLLWPETGVQMPERAHTVANVSDTVYIVKKDTVTQLRDVVRNVYIAATAAERSQTPVHRLPADHGSDGLAEASAPTLSDVIAETDDDALIAETGDDALIAETGDDALIADARPIEEVRPQERAKNYLEQYNNMLVTVSSVTITDEDRISN